MKKVLLLILMFGLIFYPFKDLIFSDVRNISVSINPNNAYVNAAYVINFNLGTDASSNLVGGVDSIYITLPLQMTIPASPNRLYIFINSYYNPQTVSIVTDASGHKVSLLLPATLSIPASGFVSVNFTSGFGLKNPSAAGTYSLSVSTSKETNPVPAGFQIMPSTVSNVLVTVIPNNISQNASYLITFNITQPVSGAAFDYLLIQFLPLVTLPSAPNINYVKINNLIPQSIGYAGFNTYSIMLPSALSLSSGATCAVSFNTYFGIINPPQEGTYSLYVSTSKDTLPVPSNFSIVGGKVSSLTAAVTPNTTNAPANIELSFKTSQSGSLTANSDKITVKLDNFTLPLSISKTYVKVNGYQVLQDPTVNTAQKTITIVTPVNIGNFQSVSVGISKDAKVRNPQVKGDYFIKVLTTKDTVFADSNKIFIQDGLVSDLKVSVSPQTEGVQAEYKISFLTSSGGALLSEDKIIIEFPSIYLLPQSIVASFILVNGVKLAKTPTVNQTLKTITIETPLSIQEQSMVEIILLAQAKIINPKPGNYTLKVSTSQDKIPVSSLSFEISPSTVSSVIVAVSPNLISENAQYVIKFNVSVKGALSINDRIYIIFPLKTQLPQVIPQNMVLVNGVSLTVPPTVDTQNRTIMVYSPVNIPNTGGVEVKILKEALIKNPDTPGSYQISLYTSSDPGSAKSNIYLIVSIPSVFIYIEPQNPDGENGWYIRKPTITFKTSSASDPQPKVFYSFTQEPGSFIEYKTPIQLQEGITTIYYYAQDKDGNRSDVYSKTYKVDLTPPVLVITYPLASFFTVYDTLFTFKGRITDGNRVLVNGVSASVDSSGYFTFSSYLIEDENSFEIKGLDEAGHSVKLAYVITYVSKIKIVIEVNKNTAFINDKPVFLDVPAIISKDRVFVPLRFIAESFKASVYWDPVFQIAFISIKDTTIVIQPGKNYASINGKKVYLDAPSFIHNGRLMVPIRFIAEAFKASVYWDPITRRVTIEYIPR